MPDWVKLSDASWQKFESILDQLTKTPPIVYELQSPQAPRKPKTQISRGSLQPKKLTFERDNSKKKHKETSFKVWEDKDCDQPIIRRVPVSFVIRNDEADKENRQEGISRRKKIKSNSRDDRLYDRGRNGLEFDFRQLRI